MANLFPFNPMFAKFPRHFALCQSKNDSIKDLWDCSINQWQLLNLRRPFNATELQSWNEIKNILPTPRQDEGSRKPIWNLSKDNLFSITYVKEALESNAHSFSMDFHRHHCSNLCHFQEMQIFQLVYHPWGINTMKILQKRNPNSYLNPYWCTLCQSNSEGIDHLFVNYRTIASLWSLPLFPLKKDFGSYFLIFNFCIFLYKL